MNIKTITLSLFISLHTFQALAMDKDHLEENHFTRKGYSKREANNRNDSNEKRDENIKLYNQYRAPNDFFNKINPIGETRRTRKAIESAKKITVTWGENESLTLEIALDENRYPMDVNVNRIADMLKNEMSRRQTLRTAHEMRGSLKDQLEMEKRGLEERENQNKDRALKQISKLKSRASSTTYPNLTEESPLSHMLVAIEEMTENLISKIIKLENLEKVTDNNIKPAGTCSGCSSDNDSVKTDDFKGKDEEEDVIILKPIEEEDIKVVEKKSKKGKKKKDI